MAVKPNNVVPAIGDKIVNATWTFNTSLTEARFFDADTDYDIVEVKGVVTTALNVSAATATISVGHSGVVSHPTYGTVSALATAFVDTQAGPASGAVGAVSTITQTTAHKVLPAGSALIVTRTSNSNASTGVMYVQIRLRPKTAARGNASKRPTAAQSTLS